MENYLVGQYIAFLYWMVGVVVALLITGRDLKYFFSNQRQKIDKWQEVLDSTEGDEDAASAAFLGAMWIKLFTICFIWPISLVVLIIGVVKKIFARDSETNTK